MIFELWFDTLIRWHDAGTYDVNTKTGGPNGSIRNEEEFTHGANSGLKIALEFCGEFCVRILFIIIIFFFMWTVLIISV